MRRARAASAAGQGHVSLPMHLSRHRGAQHTPSGAEPGISSELGRGARERTSIFMPAALYAAASCVW